MENYKTEFGIITLYKNEVYIGSQFKNGNYWDIDTLNKIKDVIKHLFVFIYSYDRFNNFFF